MSHLCLLLLIVIFFTGFLSSDGSPFRLQVPDFGTLPAKANLDPSVKFTVNMGVFTAGTNYTEKCVVKNFNVKEESYTILFWFNPDESMQRGSGTPPKWYSQKWLLGAYLGNGHDNLMHFQQIPSSYAHGVVKQGNVSESWLEYTISVRLTKDLPKGGQLYCLLAWSAPWDYYVGSGITV